MPPLAETVTLQTRLSRADCYGRLDARIDRRPVTFRIDPARPVRGRSSLDGFVVRRSRDAAVDARGTYFLAGEGTRIELRYAPAWRSQLWWMALNAVILGPLGGVMLWGFGRVPGDPATVIATASALMMAVVILLGIVVYMIGLAVFGPRQRAYLRTFLEQTLAAR
jgi:hypothetical protein